jgi:hypothetical protein
MWIVDKLIGEDEEDGTAEGTEGTDLFEDYDSSYSTDGHGNVNDRPRHLEEAEWDDGSKLSY